MNIALWITLAFAEPGPGMWIAPGPAELGGTLSAVEEKIGRAEGIGEAATRLQNVWGAELAAGHARPCEEDAAANAVAGRILAFGGAWRDAVQSARAEDDRLEVLVGAPTVTPLLDAETGARVARARARVEEQVASYLEFSAWHTTFFLGSARGCQTGLTTAAGPTRAGPGVSSGPVAVIGLGGGTLCPDRLPADGTVQLLGAPRVCMAGPDCGCEPVPVDPGAVLFGRAPASAATSSSGTP